MEGRHAFEDAHKEHQRFVEKEIAESTQSWKSVDSRLANLEQSLLERPQENDALRDGASVSWSERVLSIFRLQAMDSREENIEEAQQDTFRWILEGCSNDMWDWIVLNLDLSTGTSQKDPWSLQEWLAQHSGIFRISGKPGSGKSTLMKMLVSHPRCNDLLNRWADQSILLKFKFFAFKAGNKSQRSMQGFLQSVIYQLLEHDESLIRKIFDQPEQKVMLQLDGFKGFPDQAGGRMYPLSELLKVWTAFKSAASNTTRAILFLDGLDEFGEDMMPVLRFVEEVSSSGWMKVIIAARDLQAFDDHLGNRKILLHEWTKFDIQQIVYKALYSHEAVRIRMHTEPKAFESLMDRILQSAEGVIIWVKTVVASLLDGFRDGDTADELRSRLRKMPTEIFRLYRSILDELSPDHLREALSILKYVRAYSSLVSFPTVEKLIQSRSYARAEPEWVIEWMNSSDSLRSSLVDTMQRRIRSRCSHFLSIKLLDWDEGQYNVIDILHRSVEDFLEDAFPEEMLMEDKDLDLSIAMAELAPWPQLGGFEAIDYDLLRFYRAIHDFGDAIMQHAECQKQLLTYLSAWQLARSLHPVSMSLCLPGWVAFDFWDGLFVMYILSAAKVDTKLALLCVGFVNRISQALPHILTNERWQLIDERRKLHLLTWILIGLGEPPDLDFIHSTSSHTKAVYNDSKAVAKNASLIDYWQEVSWRGKNRGTVRETCIQCICSSTILEPLFHRLLQHLWVIYHKLSNLSNYPRHNVRVRNNEVELRGCLKHLWSILLTGVSIVPVCDLGALTPSPDMNPLIPTCLLFEQVAHFIDTSPGLSQLECNWESGLRVKQDMQQLVGRILDELPQRLDTSNEGYRYDKRLYDLSVPPLDIPYPTEEWSEDVAMRT